MNVHLSSAVPIVPDWVSGSSLELWAHSGAGADADAGAPPAPLAALLNDTVHHAAGTLHDGEHFLRFIVNKIIAVTA